MGALTGGITATAYYVEGELPSDFRERFVKALEARSFREIDVDSDQEESLGWVDMRDPFETALDLERVLWGNYMQLGMRQDTLRVPGAIFKMHLQRAIRLEQIRQTRDRLSRAEEDEIRDRLEKELRRRILPSIKSYDLVWNIERGEAWFFTSNKRMNEIFQDFFTDTFELVLIPRNVYSRLERAGMADDALERATTLEPTVFAIPPDMRR
jgi:recombination associated protein RdgC